jgi:hypothetical protein
MRLCGLILLVGSLSSSYSSFILDVSVATVENEFQRFVAKYNKSYVIGGKEYLERLAVFKVRIYAATEQCDFQRTTN